MTITKTELDHSLELYYLRTRLTELEKLIGEEKSAAATFNVLRTFNVVLKVTTLPSSWQNNHVDSADLAALFTNSRGAICEAAHLLDDGDSIQVESVTEVDPK